MANLSNYARVGDTITWKSAAGQLAGRVIRIDRNKSTADPLVNADYYLTNTGCYLNSNMMKKMNVEVIR